MESVLLYIHHITDTSSQQIVPQYPCPNAWAVITGYAVETISSNINITFLDHIEWFHLETGQYPSYSQKHLCVGKTVYYISVLIDWHELEPFTHFIPRHILFPRPNAMK